MKSKYTFEYTKFDDDQIKEFEKQARAKQVERFEKIKQSLPSHISIKQVVMGLFNVSESTAYRYTTGITLMVMYEVELLNKAFPEVVSTEARSMATSKITAEISRSGHKKYTIPEQLNDVLKELQMVEKDSQACIYSMSANLSLFYIYSQPQLAAFHFYWLRRSILGSRDYDYKVFDLNEEMNKPEVKLAGEIWNVFQNISSTEIWTKYTVLTYLAKINEVKTAGLFKQEADRQEILDAMLRVMQLLNEQSITGIKNNNKHVHFHLYSNETHNNNNYTIIKMNNKLHFYLLHNIKSVLMCHQQDFCAIEMADFENYLRQGVPLSVNNGQTRKRIMHEYYEAIMKEKVK